MRKLLTVMASVILSTSAFAGTISGNWKFPSDIAVNNGKLFVVDGLNNRIAVYDLYGEHETDIKIKSPFGIDAKDGLLYVVSQDGTLYVLDEYGNIEKKLHLEGRPIDVAKVGNKLFVSNGKTQTLDVYDLNGNFLKRIGGKGSAPGEFVGIFMLDSSKKRVFVVDSLNARIEEFDSKGNFLNAFGKFGIEEGDLFRPKSVAYCNGKLVVSDGITGAVQLFEETGGFDRVIAKGLNYPTAVACYKGEVFVLEPLKNRVSTFSIQGVR
jgi:DNA-binding beta-propeller fold protein YncE